MYAALYKRKWILIIKNCFKIVKGERLPKFCKISVSKNNTQITNTGWKVSLIRSLSDTYFPAIRQNKERFRVPLRIQSRCRKIRTRETPNMDTFHAVKLLSNTPKQNLNSVAWYSIIMINLNWSYITSLSTLVKA